MFGRPVTAAETVALSFKDIAAGDRRGGKRRSA